MGRKGLLGVTNMSPEKWETQKVYRKEKEVKFDGDKRKVLHIFPCIEEKGFATNSLQGKFHLRKFLPLKELSLHTR